MKLKIVLLALFTLFTMQSFAQTDIELPANSILDFEEDTTDLTTLQDILDMQNLVYSKGFRSDVVKSVWKYKKHFSLSYVQTGLTGTDIAVYDASEKKFVPRELKLKTDWAANLKRARTYALHKKAIGNVLSFGIEYAALDLSVSHYKCDSTASYNSSVFRTEVNNEGEKSEYNGMPWGSEMYTATYGMNIGPSITIAPFARTRYAGLAHLRLQGYYTVGYRASLMWINMNDKMDENRNNNSDENYKAVNKSNKLLFSHGLTMSWGVRLNWKFIAVGFEVMGTEHEYMPIEKNIYGSDKYKFTESQTRLSLIYMW